MHGTASSSTLSSEGWYETVYLQIFSQRDTSSSSCCPTVGSQPLGHWVALRGPADTCPPRYSAHNHLPARYLLSGCLHAHAHMFPSYHMPTSHPFTQSSMPDSTMSPGASSLDYASGARTCCTSTVGSTAYRTAGWGNSSWRQANSEAFMIISG